MKTKLLMCGLATLAGTTVALAAPRETANLVTLNGGPIPSKDRQGDPDNIVLSVNFLGSDGGGSYEATYLTFTGTIGQTFGASWTRETCILITPPGGTPFIYQLSPNNTAAVPMSATNAFCVPVSTFTTAGTWTFEFFDFFDDISTGNLIDANWTACTVTLNDGPIPAPSIGAGPSSTFLNTPVDGTQAAPGATLNWNNTTAGSFNGIRLSGIATGGGTDGANNYNPGVAGLTTDLRIAMTPPGGATVLIQPTLATSTSSTAFDITVGFAGTPVGNWTFNIFDNANLATVSPDNWMNTFTAELVTVPAPTPTIPITLVANTTVSNTQAYTASQIRWYTFNLANNVILGGSNALQIDTEGSAVTNPSIGLYDAQGTRVNADFDDGSGNQAQLTFGTDASPAVGTGLVYNGRDGALLAGTYYLAVISSNGTYGPATWSVVPGAGAVGNATVNFRYLDPSVTPATPPATVTDLGTLGGTDPVTASFEIATSTDVAWVKFTTPADILPTNEFFLDIDTEGTVLAVPAGGRASDTEIGLFSSAGAALLADDDDGTDFLSQITIGNAAEPRPAPGNGQPRNGIDSASLAAGTYYLALAVDNTTFAANFVVTHTATLPTDGSNGTMVVNITSNFPDAPTTCSLADVGVAGGLPGQDNRLDNNDFIAFINFFFAQNAAADLGIAGGLPGSDNAWDNNDFIAFINHFFNDSANCNG